jgi:cytochrome c5
VSGLLPRAGFPEGVNLDALCTIAALEEGRDVLLQKCVQCHDLRTVLLRPRTPQNWVETVRRMASRSVFDPLTETEQWRVSTYLIAISPELQKSFSLKKEQDIARTESKATSLEAVRAAHAVALAPAGTMDLASAKEIVEELCTQCHGLKNLEKEPPASQDEAVELVGRMVENGLECSEEELAAVIFYLTETYTK